MRTWILLGVFAALCAGCATETEETAPPRDDASVTEEVAPVETANDPIKERWCNSYKSPQFCPTNVCMWHTSPAPGYCGLPKYETE
jgi:hypothetical protein